MNIHRPESSLRISRGSDRVKRPYLKESRLADLLALTQVLALDEHAYRSEKGLTDELQGSPASADTWREVALDHPELFRVSAKDEPLVSLTSRHVLPKDQGYRQPLPADFTQQLLRMAIELHDRQVEAASRWRTWIPLLLAALIAGLFSIGVVYFGWRLGQAGVHGQNQVPTVSDSPAAKP